ncbi:uncharacterized protein LOC144704484 [Wolffia australiana]
MAERRIGYVTSTARTLLLNYSIPWTYWGEAVLTATHLINRLPSQPLQFNSPIDRMSAAFPAMTLRTNLLPRVFGCTAYVHDTTSTLTKLDARALKCIFVGYSTLQKGYKCFHPSTRRFLISANVAFAEFQPFFGSSSSSDLPPREASSSPFLDPFPSVAPTAPPPPPTDVTRVPPPPPHDSSPVVASDSCPSMEFPPPVSSPPTHVNSAPLLSPSSESSAPAVTSSPTSIASAPTSLGPPSPSAPPGADDDPIGWPIALRKGVSQSSIPSIFDPHCFGFCPTPSYRCPGLSSLEGGHGRRNARLGQKSHLGCGSSPPGKKAVGCKWVHTPKHRADGSLECRKSQLVARGFT